VLVQPPQHLIPDLVLALDLAHDELGVADQLDLACAERVRSLEPEHQRPILGDVVGRRADPLAVLLEHLSVRRRHHHADRRGAGVATCAAVDVDDEALGSAHALSSRAGASPSPF
jgi:hypothetical protein